MEKSKQGKHFRAEVTPFFVFYGVNYVSINYMKPPIDTDTQLMHANQAAV